MRTVMYSVVELPRHRDVGDRVKVVINLSSPSSTDVELAREVPGTYGAHLDADRLAFYFSPRGVPGTENLSSHARALVEAVLGKLDLVPCDVRCIPARSPWAVRPEPALEVDYRAPRFVPHGDHRLAPGWPAVVGRR